jgi:hypothetical protein
MTAPQKTRLRSRWCLAGLVIAAGCVCFSPSLNAAVVVEKFTDYSAFLSLLGSGAQVVNFDDVPTPNGYGYFGPNRYADQGIVIDAEGTATVFPSLYAVSPSNVYAATFPPNNQEPFPPGAFRPQTILTFTRDGQPALTSAFGTFFINNESVFGENLSGLAIGGDYNFILPGLTGPNGSTFLGLATVDSATGQLVPAINDIFVAAGSQSLLNVYLDNFTFASPVSPVPEGNALALFAAAALAAVGLSRRRPAAPPKAARRSTMKTIITSMGRPLRCALCTVLIGTAALWAPPRNACAQLYVSQSGVGGTVGEYDAATGAAINANLVTGLSDPFGLAVSGNTLFVADGDTVGEYDAATGAAINASFIPTLAGPGLLTELLVSPVPEASPWSMMAGGGVALLAVMLRKKYRSA